MKFYRVQDADNRGPYNCDFDELLPMMQAHQQGHDLGTHPAVWREHMSVFMSGEHVCGFASWGKLTRWFEGFGDDLHRVGFSIAVFEIPECEIFLGERQDIVDSGYTEMENAVDLLSLQGI